jgi:hypothetical protein
MSELRKAYLEQIEDYCNVTFDEDNLPGGIKVALTELVSINPSEYRISSEKIDGLAKTYSNTDGDIPKYIRTWLEPYRRLHLVGNKKKRPYDAGR